MRAERSALALKQSESLASLQQKQEQRASEVFERIERRGMQRAQSAQRQTARNELKEERDALRGPHLGGTATPRQTLNESP